ncbi:ECF transporter S component [Promethearchaeum syntrophicum]|uniref:ECF transporter S component n=1 Tax=Promethearchaeum syntrophicum TaxID=2594042 RepID=A0A5B9DAK0_9ARCH|nr:ECF transporter S component [Candidatus Prometheoarchaeum syntrophicum]
MEIENVQPNIALKVERDVPDNKRRTVILNIAIMGILTALETILTTTVSIPIPATTGYFNVGEGLIYFTAVLFGPYIGAFVGGVGAAFADILGPYAIFAPGTFIAKGAEGFIVGLVFKYLQSNENLKNNWRIFTIILGVVAGGLMAIFADGVFPIIILGVILAVIIWILGLTVQKNISVKILSMMAGGMAMVLGYFLYESLILNLISPGYFSNPLNAAVIEIPLNILQVLSGIFIAIPLITALEPVVKNYYK